MCKLQSVSILLASLTGTLLATDASDSAAASGCLGGCAFFFILLFVFNILILFWVSSDFKKRTGSTSVGWVLLNLFFGIIGLIIYLVARPAGSFVKCPNCAKDKIITMPICPHCGQKVIA